MTIRTTYAGLTRFLLMVGTPAIAWALWTMAGLQ